MLCDNSTLLNTMPYWYLPFPDACFFYISCQKDNVAGFLLKLMFEFNLVFFWFPNIVIYSVIHPYLRNQKRQNFSKYVINFYVKNRNDSGLSKLRRFRNQDNIKNVVLHIFIFSIERQKIQFNPQSTRQTKFSYIFFW